MIKEFIDLYNYHRKHCVEGAASEIECFRRFKSRCLKLLNKPMTELKVLDVGCGKTYPFSYLFHLEGSHVTSLDTQHITTGINKYAKMLYHNGIKVSLKSFLRDILFTPTERKILKAGAAASNKTSNITFICSSAKEIPFPNNSFDVVFSFCAFEHIPDVEKAISECARIVTPEDVGIPFRKRDIDSFASKIGFVLENPSYCEELGTKAKERAKREYNWGKIGTQTAEVYYSLFSLFR